MIGRHILGLTSVNQRIRQDDSYIHTGSNAGSMSKRNCGSLTFAACKLESQEPTIKYK